MPGSAFDNTTAAVHEIRSTVRCLIGDQEGVWFSDDDIDALLNTAVKRSQIQIPGFIAACLADSKDRHNLAKSIRKTFMLEIPGDPDGFKKQIEEYAAQKVAAERERITQMIEDLHKSGESWRRESILEVIAEKIRSS